MKFASRAVLSPPSAARRSSGVVPLRRCPPVAGARSLALAATARTAIRPDSPGKSFGRKRIEHAVEVTGACIMLAVFLMLALLA